LLIINDNKLIEKKSTDTGSSAETEGKYDSSFLKETNILEATDCNRDVSRESVQSNDQNLSTANEKVIKNKSNIIFFLCPQNNMGYKP
jgi:hypothetical protein